METNKEKVSVFISGNRDLSEKDFITYYLPYLHELTSNENVIFNISDDDKVKFEKYELIAPVVNKVFSYATKEGIMTLLKQSASKYVTKEFDKYIPFFGSALAAIAGYKLTNALGKAYVDDCYNLAKSILDDVIVTRGKNQKSL